MRQVRDGINGVPQVPDSGAQAVAQRPVGGPSGPTSAPAPYDPLSDLAHALSTLQPGLERFAATRKKEDDDAQIALGAKARVEQDGLEPIAMTPEQNPAWQKGYMKQHGIMAGAQAATDMKEQYEAQKDNPDFHPNTFFAGFKQAQLAGLNDHDALEGFLPQLTNAEGNLRQDWAKRRVDDMRNNQVEALNAGARELVGNFSGKDDGQKREMFDAWVDLQRRTNGQTRRGAAQALVTEMALKAGQANPEDYDWLSSQKDPMGGATLADMVMPNGQRAKTLIDTARQQAVERQQRMFKEVAAEANIQTSIQFEKQLLEDPTQLGDPATFVQQHAGQYGMFATGESAAAAVQKISVAQQKWEDLAAKRAVVEKLGPYAPRAILDDPEIKKIYDAKNRDLWMQTDMTKPESVASTVTQLVSRFQVSGVLDSRLSSMLESSATMGSAGVRGPDGKLAERPTAEFLMTANIYKAITKSNNPQLISKMPDDAQSIFSTFWRRVESGSTELDAFNTAKFVGSAEGKERVKTAWNEQQEAALRVQAASVFSTRSPFTFNGVGFTGSVTNATDMANLVVRRAKEKVSMGGVSPEDAYAQALDDVRNTHTFVTTGNGMLGTSLFAQGAYVELPKDANREVVTKGLEGYLSDSMAAYKAAHGTDLSQFTVARSGDGYVVLDSIHMPVAPAKSIDELTKDVAAREHNDPASVAAAQNLNQSLAAGQMTEHDVRARWGDIQTAFNTGRMDARTYEHLSATRKKNMLAEQDASVARFRMSQDAFSVPDPGFLNDQKDLHVGAPIPNPTGLNLSTKDYALKYAESNPDFAITAFGEGLRLKVYPDSKGQKTIGLGYNISSRDPAVVKKEFASAGIEGERVDRVINGTEQITPAEAVRLYDTVKQGYVAIAKAPFGPQWDSFPPHVKAVLTDVAYNAGNVAKFTTVVNALKKGDFDTASKSLTVSYYDKARGQQVYNERRVNIWRAMMAGPAVFSELVKKGA